jgi:hypothetical protein
MISASVGHVGRGDLEPRDAVGGEVVDAGRVPRRAHHLDPDIGAVVEDLEELVGGQVELRQQVEGVLRAEVLAAAASGTLAVEGVHVAQLELHHVGAGLDRAVDELLGEVDRALVVDADLADHQGRAVAVDLVAADADLVVAVDRDGDQTATLVDQRHVVDPVAEHGRDLGGRGVDRRRADLGVCRLARGTVEVDGVLGGHPPAEVAVGKRALEMAVAVDEEDDAGLVGRDLLQGAQHRVLGVHQVRRQVALDDHPRILSFHRVGVRLLGKDGGRRAAQR